MRCIVFSRDRALQLDGLLRSIGRHVRGVYDPLIVLYRVTSPGHRRAYGLLRSAWPTVRWIEERDFARDLVEHLGCEEYLVFHTDDDDLFFRPFQRFSLRPDEVCFALRLGLNTTYCYPLDVEESFIAPLVEGDRVSWAWNEQPPGALSYPLALNGHVFRGAEIAAMIRRSTFANPNELEAALQAFAGELPGRMAAFHASVVVSVPANIVNETFPNRHGDLHPVDELNHRFLAGERLDLDGMDFSSVDACHVEIPYAFAGR